MRGTLTLKVSSLAGKLSAKAVLQAGSLSFRGEAWTAAAGEDGSFHTELAAGYLFRADTADAVYPAGTGVVSAADGPLSEPVAVSGNRLMMAKGVRPVLSDGAYDYSGANSALATLSFAPDTGIFNGRIRCRLSGCQACDGLPSGRSGA